MQTLTETHDCPLCGESVVELTVRVDPGTEPILARDPANSVEPTAPSIESIDWLGWIGERCGCEPDEIIEMLWGEIEGDLL